MGRKKSFTPEFKQDAVEYYYSSGQSLEKASADLKISQSSLNNWVQSAKNNDGAVPHRGSGNYESDEAKEIAKLKKELRDAQATIDILKKAMSILND